MNLTTRKSEEESKCVWQSSRGLIEDLWKLLETAAEITSVPKWEKCAIMHGLYPFQDGLFGSKTKMLKNMQKTSLEPQQKYSKQKFTPETPSSRKITSTVLKSEKFAILYGP